MDARGHYEKAEELIEHAEKVDTDDFAVHAKIGPSRQRSTPCWRMCIGL